MATPISLISRGTNSIYIKRDDLIPFSFGGNKARKASYFFQEIDTGGYGSVVTYGSSSSNHCRVVANMCVARKLPCTIISPEESSKPTFNSQMMSLFGAKILRVPVVKVHETIESVLNDARSEGYNPYFIGGGGHGDLGTQAYFDCYKEIRAYETIEHIHFDYIFLASGTGTTQAGLVCGQLFYNEKRSIIGISIARTESKGRQVVVDCINSYLQNKDLIVSNDKILETTNFVDDYIGEGYSSSSVMVRNTINEVMMNYGIPMDLTYTGKAYFGMLDYISRNSISGKNILFIHTGGTPLFFDTLQSMPI